MPFACVYVPDFFLQAVARNRDSAAADNLRNKPVAVLDGNPPLVNVIAANEKARVAGIWKSLGL